MVAFNTMAQHECCMVRASRMAPYLHYADAAKLLQHFEVVRVKAPPANFLHNSQL